jgi:ribA/ribD-fused uncharacterized protein
MDKYVFFWGGIYSQWYHAPIFIDGVEYNCNEQFMMAEKARCFGDTEALEGIMNAKNPSTQKAWGRKVKNFDPIKWNEISRLVVYRANLAKFTQDSQLQDILLKSGDKTIVEASPEDRIWGIGMSELDPDRFDESKWQGTNWLGIAIMQVRSDIRSLKKHGNVDAPDFVDFPREQARIWIDDVREPPNTTWVWAKNSDEAISFLCDYEPLFISFDHDLGHNDDAMKVVNQIELWAEGGYIKRFPWAIHSMNPVGRENIERGMRAIENIWNIKEEEQTYI